MRPDGDVGGPSVVELDDLANVVVGLLPGIYSVYVGLLWTRRSVKDLHHIERIQTKRLAHFSPPLAVIG